MKVIFKGLPIAALSIILSVFFMAVTATAKEDVHAAKGMQALHVDVYKVPKPSNIPVELEYPARLKSIQKITVTARVFGTLTKKFYTEGQFVKKGDLLYEIEPDTYKAAVDAAKAQLKSAQAALNKAKRDWNRIKALYEANAASQKTRDAALSAYEIAKANIEKARADLKTASINFNYTRVKAAISGIAGVKLIDVGNLVTNGTPLTTITKLNPIYAEFSIPDINIIKEKYYAKNGQWGKFGKNLKAVLKINGVQYLKEGSVDFIDSNIDEKTSTVKARAIFKNTDSYLMPGEFARVALKGLFVKNAILIPQGCVLQNPLGTVVFVANKGKAQVRPVKLGDTSGKYYIIEKGLKKGDLVIVDNFFRIRPGIPVKIDKIVNIDIKDR